MRAVRLAQSLRAACLFLVVACAAPEEFTQDLLYGRAVGDEIIVCGERYSVGAPVILWTDPGGYDAYSTDYHFGRPRGVKNPPSPGELRYTPGRMVSATGEVLATPGSEDPSELAQVVDQLVLHYDACGYSMRCFQVLHDIRGLSVHFMIDLDGTIYQTLDVNEQAWHAAKANVRSVGVEIANIGARPIERAGELEQWYGADEEGPFVRLPEDAGNGGLLRSTFVARPARPRPVRGPVQGELFAMYDLTPAQYDSLVKLSVTLCQIFPKLGPEVPRTADGRIRWDVLSDEEYAAFAGILGHYHVSGAKQDPGPAFDWERYLARVRTRLLADS